jgi:hypothetical protein
VSTRCAPLILALASLAAPARAGDGVIEINQQVALAGTIPGDAPGFPVRLVSPGSYRLSGNLVVPLEAFYGIEVVAAGATLDLGGFSIVGPATCTGSGATLDCSPETLGGNVGVYSQRALTLRNGTIRGMASFGADLFGGGLVEDLVVLGNGSHGLRVSYVTMRRVIASRNEGSGISCSECAISDVVATGNLGRGIDLGIESTLQRGVSRLNGSAGVFAFAATLLQHSSMVGNTGVGLAGSTVGGNNAYGQNAIQGNGGTVQAGIGAVQLGLNLCEGDTICP